jgi:hypothetical protein
MLVVTAFTRSEFVNDAMLGRAQMNRVLPTILQPPARL